MGSSKKNLLKFQTVIDGDMSTATITSTVSSIAFLDDIGLQFNWTGSPVGTFAIQVSADYAQDAQGNVQNTGNWVPLTLTYWNGAAFVTATSLPTSVGSPIYLDLALLSAPWIRTVYTKTSGTGTLNSFITAKSVSG